MHPRQNLDQAPAYRRVTTVGPLHAAASTPNRLKPKTNSTAPISHYGLLPGLRAIPSAPQGLR